MTETETENNWLYIVATGSNGEYFRGWVNGLRQEDGSLDYSVGFQPIYLNARRSSWSKIS